MAEKVIFEFKAQNNAEGGCRFGFGHGTHCFRASGPDVWAWCWGGHESRVPGSGGSARPRHKRGTGRQHVRETLSFFERLYDDLFGENAPGESAA